MSYSSIYIYLYPNGNSEDEGKSLSMNLYLEDSLDAGDIVQAIYIMRIKNQLEEKEDHQVRGECK